MNDRIETEKLANKTPGLLSRFFQAEGSSTDVQKSMHASRVATELHNQGYDLAVKPVSAAPQTANVGSGLSTASAAPITMKIVPGGIYSVIKNTHLMANFVANIGRVQHAEHMQEQHFKQAASLRAAATTAPHVNETLERVRREAMIAEGRISADAIVQVVPASKPAVQRETVGAPISKTRVTSAQKNTPNESLSDIAARYGIPLRSARVGANPADSEYDDSCSSDSSYETPASAPSQTGVKSVPAVQPRTKPLDAAMPRAHPLGTDVTRFFPPAAPKASINNVGSKLAGSTGASNWAADVRIVKSKCNACPNCREIPAISAQLKDE